MRRSPFGWAAAAIIAVGAASFAWLWFAGGSGEPSTDLTTPTIAGGADLTTSTVGESASTFEVSPTTGSGGQRGPVSFVLDPERSAASFEIAEELRGSPQQVVGTTREVAGQVLVDPSDLTTTQFSEIVINARTLETDSSRRDRAIRGPVILNSASDEFEFITFEVASVEGLEGSLSVGATIEFRVTGDLTVKGTTNQETFSVRAVLVDESTIEGSATTIVSRESYGIGIPSVPGVANVGDQVGLDLEFVLTSS